MTGTIRNVFILLFLIFICVPHIARAESIQVLEITYGTSFSGKKLMAHKIFKEGKFALRKMALLTDGIHGNEYTGIGTDFITHFKDSKSKWSKGFLHFLNEGGVFLIVPQVNPDGVKKGSRFSSLGSDLNRDFNTYDAKPFFSQQETFYLDQFVRSQMSASTQLVLAVDYHCCARSLLYPPTISTNQASILNGFYDSIFLALKKSLGTNYVLATTSAVFGEKLKGTMKNYWFNEFGTLSFTFEGHDPNRDSTQSKKHLQWWDSMLGYISKLAPKSIALLKEMPGRLNQKSILPGPDTLKYSE